MLWTTNNDPIFLKEGESLKKLRRDLERMAAWPPTPPRASAPAKGRGSKSGNDFIIYGKRKGEKRFQAFDGEGLTNRLLYAMHYPADHEDYVDGLVDELNRMNPEYVFEKRRANGTIFGGKP